MKTFDMKASSYMSSTEKSKSGQPPGSDFLSLTLNGTPATLWVPLTLYAIARTLACAAMKPFSIDEVLTHIICHQPNVQTIWQALGQGADGQPPLFYVIERSVSWLVPNEHVGYRLLSAVGFVCALTLLYVFVKTRNGTAPALVCASLLLMTPLFTIYAAEARPYSMLTAFVAIAMVCYQRAPSLLWTVGMFLSLFLACSVHYYAVFSLFPFFLAELTVVYNARRIRFGVWLALLAALAPLGISWSLLMKMKHLWAPHFFATSSLRSLPRVYSWYFGVSPGLGTALGGAAFLMVLATFAPKRAGNPRISLQKPASERVLLLGFIILPIIGYAVAKITHGPFIDRYFLPAILGIAAAVGYALERVKPRGTVAAAVIILLAIGVQELGFWTSPRHRVVPVEQVSSLAKLAERVGRDDIPIVVSDFGVYLATWYYAPPALKRRITALADPVSAVKYIGTDTSDQLALAVRSYAPVAVQDFAPFAAAHRVFLLYSTKSLFDWWPARLTRDGDRLQLLAVDGPEAIYLVELRMFPAE